MRILTKRNINAAEVLFSKLTGWQIANEAISIYFDQNPANAESSTVAVKVVLISSLYYTHILEPVKMAVHIAGLQKLDSELINGDINAVERIAHLDRYEASFASKYAHFHNRDAFPILDNFASGAVAILLGKSLKYTYPDFYNNISFLRQKSGLNSTDWRSLDKYLWLYGQKKMQLDKGIKVNKEVTALFNTSEGEVLFNDLEPKNEG